MNHLDPEPLASLSKSEFPSRINQGAARYLEMKSEVARVEEQSPSPISVLPVSVLATKKVLTVDRPRTEKAPIPKSRCAR